MEDYLRLLLEQIRCRKAWPMIEREIRGHLEDQVAVNCSAGMGEKKAVEHALLDMGDPVEVGVELDRIHRPQVAWDLIVLMAVISVASLMIHFVIGRGQESVAGYAQNQYIAQTAVHIAMGFVMMLFVLRIDYSIFSRCGKIVATVFLAFLTLEILVFGISVNGAKAWFVVGNMTVNIGYLMFLYVPLYGAVLYGYRGSGWRGIAMALLYLLYPVYLAKSIPSLSLSVLLLVTMAAMFLVAVWKGWFRASKKAVTAVVLVMLGLPAACIYVLFSLKFLPEYQRERLLSLFHGDYMQYDYASRIILEYSKSNRLIGSGSTGLTEHLPEYYSDFIISFVSGYFGIAAAAGICILLGIVLLRTFRISLCQRNQLGMIMGLGCGMVLAISAVLNIAQNFSLLPRTQTFFPFFSFGGTQIVVSYVLVGIVLSVYRHKNILSDGKKSELRLFRGLHRRSGLQG